MPQADDQPRTVYNRVAGQSLERIAALSDGIFAVAMTLMVLEIHVPLPEGVATESDLMAALLRLGPAFVTYLMSFLTLGIFWTGQQTQLSHIDRSDRDLAWINFAFLAAVSILPFSTRLLTDYLAFHTALIVYWANIAVLGGLLYAAWSHASGHGLLRSDAPPHLDAAVRRRIVVAQALYAGAAALSFIHTGIGIGLILLIQLNYAIAPRRAWLERHRNESGHR